MTFVKHSFKQYVPKNARDNFLIVRNTTLFKQLFQPLCLDPLPISIFLNNCKKISHNNRLYGMLTSAWGPSLFLEPHKVFLIIHNKWVMRRLFVLVSPTRTRTPTCLQSCFYLGQIWTRMGMNINSMHITLLICIRAIAIILFVHSQKTFVI